MAHFIQGSVSNGCMTFLYISGINASVLAVDRHAGDGDRLIPGELDRHLIIIAGYVVQNKFSFLLIVCIAKHKTN
jgi:hypothetical protein